MGDDGVGKALAQQARDERTKQLQDMDADDLRALCEANSIDGLVTEVMADRVVKAEKMTGRFARPSTEKKKEKVESSEKIDLIESLLASEASRKANEKKREEEEEAMMAKMKEIRGKPLEDLKKVLKKKGAEAEGKKKDELAKTLFDMTLQEEAVNARTSELKNMDLKNLKAIVLEKAIECGASRGSMVNAVLDHEAKCREEMKAFDAKAAEVVTRKKEELEGKTLSELKDLCSEKNLAVGGGKDDKIARLLEEARADGEIDAGVSAVLFQQRKSELISSEKSLLATLCEKMEVCPYVKEVMIERVLAHEDECGTVAEPPSKKRRK